jgi:hypothetical protein
MKLSFHGGNCCGIKHIHGLLNSPDYMVDERELDSLDPFFNEKYELPPNGSKQTPCYESRPRETAEERLRFYIDWLEKNRPFSLVEVTLAPYQKLEWHKTLLDIGFVEVTTFLNSNSGCHITVYHLKIEKPEYYDPEEDDEYQEEEEEDYEFWSD